MIDLYYINDFLDEDNLRLNLELRDFKGKLIKTWTKKFKSAPNNSKKIMDIDYSIFLKKEGFLRNKYLHAKIYKEEKIISEKIEYLTEFKNLDLTEPKFEYEVNSIKDYFQISFSSKNLVKNLFVSSSIENNFSDNYFDLIPNKIKTIKIEKEKGVSFNSFKQSLKFISLYDTY
jgi:beta-mannosidase